MSTQAIVQDEPTRARGTTNGNARGSAEDRRRRRAYLMVTYASDVEGFVRCYRCGDLLFNEDDPLIRVTFTEPVTWVVRQVLNADGEIVDLDYRQAEPITVDRITPGCQGGSYKRTNIRPACGGCNSSTGGRTRSNKRKVTKP